MFHDLLFLAGQKHRGATFDGDSVLRSTHCTQTQRLIQRPVLHTRHIHIFNSLGEYNHLNEKFQFGLFKAGFIRNILPLQETLLSVATWLKSHPKEIVILACSHFEGIDDKLHEAFIFSLKKLFGSKLCPRKVSFPPCAADLRRKSNTVPYTT